MKKAITAIVSVIYVIAIILVAFLGVQAEIRESAKKVEATGISLLDLKDNPTGHYIYYYDGSENKSARVYEIISRPEEEQIDPVTKADEKGDTWEINNVKFGFIIKVFNLNYIIDTPDWKVGQIQGSYAINATVLPEDATMQSLLYSKVGAEDSSIEIDNKTGVITFPKLNSTTLFTVGVSATDNSGLTINIRFVVQKYKN